MPGPWPGKEVLPFGLVRTRLSLFRVLEQPFLGAIAYSKLEELRKLHELQNSLWGQSASDSDKLLFVFVDCVILSFFPDPIIQ